MSNFQLMLLMMGPLVVMLTNITFAADSCSVLAVKVQNVNNYVPTCYAKPTKQSGIKCPKRKKRSPPHEADIQCVLSANTVPRIVVEGTYEPYVNGLDVSNNGKQTVNFLVDTGSSISWSVVPVESQYENLYKKAFVKEDFLTYGSQIGGKQLSVKYKFYATKLTVGNIAAQPVNLGIFQYAIVGSEHEVEMDKDPKRVIPDDGIKGLLGLQQHKENTFIGVLFGKLPVNAYTIVVDDTGKAGKLGIGTKLEDCMQKQTSVTFKLYANKKKQIKIYDGAYYKRIKIESRTSSDAKEFENQAAGGDLSSMGRASFDTGGPFIIFAHQNIYDFFVETIEKSLGLPTQHLSDIPIMLDKVFCLEHHLKKLPYIHISFIGQTYNNVAEEKQFTLTYKEYVMMQQDGRCKIMVAYYVQPASGTNVRKMNIGMPFFLKHYVSQEVKSAQEIYMTIAEKNANCDALKNPSDQACKVP